MLCVCPTLFAVPLDVRCFLTSSRSPVMMSYILLYTKTHRSASSQLIPQHLWKVGRVRMAGSLSQQGNEALGKRRRPYFPISFSWDSLYLIRLPSLDFKCTFKDEELWIRLALSWQTRFWETHCLLIGHTFVIVWEVRVSKFYKR